MNRLIVIISFLVLIISEYSCKKVLYGEGNTRVKGQVVDKFSGEPIPDAWVELLAGADGSWYAPGIIDSFPTDHEGKFDFTFNAERKVNYSVRGSYYELYENYVDLEVDLKDGWSNKNLELELHPWGWVKVNFINVPPIDTVSYLGCSSFADQPAIITNAINDTFQIGRRTGNIKGDFPCFIITGSSQDVITHSVHVIPHDTVDIFVNY